MDPTDRVAIELHSSAIMLWCVAQVDAPAEEQAHRVGIARLMSERAIAHTYRPLTSAIVAGIDAACIDAEVEAAIECHANAIAILARPEA